jgi:hypothetical protein
MASKAETSAPAFVDVLRCECGKLLARVLRSVVELKCSRCKRVVLLVDGRRYQEAGRPACDCLEKLRAEEVGVQRSPARDR